MPYDQDFMESVKQRISNASEAALREILLDFTALIPYDKQNNALAALDRYNRTTPAKVTTDLIEEVENLCKDVKEGFYPFKLNYEYDDWYNTDTDELIDERDLCPELEECLKSAMEQISLGHFEQVIKALDLLFALEIPCEDCDALNVMGLIKDGSIQIILSEVLRAYSQAVVMTMTGQKRVEKLFEVIGRELCRVSLSEIVKGYEVPGRDAFLLAWVKLLSGVRQDTLSGAEKHIVEAVLLRGGADALHAYAKQGGKGYDAAYLTLIHQYYADNDNARVIKTADEALDRIKGISKTRVEIADLLLQAATKEGSGVARDRGLAEGFASSLDLPHFLAFSEHGRELLEKDVLPLLAKAENFDACCIRLLAGDCEKVWKTVSKDKKYLGWSGTVKAEVIPLIAALLSKENRPGTCLSGLIQSSFASKEKYDAFLKVFVARKKPLQAEEDQRYWDWLLSEVEKRAEAIVRGQYRNKYYGVARLVAAVAEVMRSREGNSKAGQYVQLYHDTYPKHRAFRSELVKESAKVRL